jgi:hypothetical protein
VGFGAEWRRGGVDTGEVGMSGTDYTLTPILGLYKPIQNMDVDQWGNHINHNADVLDKTLLTTGGTMTGTLDVFNTLRVHAINAQGTSVAWRITDAPADQQNSDIFVNQTGLSLRLVNDAYTAATPWLTVSRTGYAISSIGLGAPLSLPADPTSALQAATKQYVDTHVTAPSSTTPSMDGTAAIGTGTTYARADHVHPSDTSRLALTGGTMTGDLTMGTGAALIERQVALGTGSAIAVNTGAVFSKTISGATTFTVTGIPASGAVSSFMLDLTNGGSATVTWWANVKWAGGTAPTLTASGRDLLGFMTYDGGTTWSGMMLGKGMA